MSNIGLPEIAIVLVIVLVIFGPKRLPQLGRSLGSGMREFKDAVTGKNKDDDPDQIDAPPPIPADRVTNATGRSEDETPSTAKTADAS
jgi:sec-independent protein translocase protein TatA